MPSFSSFIYRFQIEYGVSITRNVFFASWSSSFISVALGLLKCFTALVLHWCFQCSTNAVSLEIIGIPDDVLQDKQRRFAPPMLLSSSLLHLRVTNCSRVHFIERARQNFSQGTAASCGKQSASFCVSGTCCKSISSRLHTSREFHLTPSGSPSL